MVCPYPSLSVWCSRNQLWNWQTLILFMKYDDRWNFASCCRKITCRGEALWYYDNNDPFVHLVNNGVKYKYRYVSTYSFCIKTEKHLCSCHNREKYSGWVTINPLFVPLRGTGLLRLLRVESMTKINKISKQSPLCLYLLPLAGLRGCS